jgi:hypothetical protein
MEKFQPQGSEALEKEKHIEFVQGLLQSLRGDILFSIFQHIFERAGIPFDVTKFITPEQVNVVCMDTVLAGNCFEGSIMINAFHVGQDDEGQSRTQVLKTYIHELTHQLSGAESDAGGKRDGFQVSVGSEKAHTEINEAMTELIQDQIFRAYLKQSGDRIELAGEDGVVRKRISYGAERQEVLSLIDRAALHFGISKQDVFRALVAGYFSNASGDMVDFFDEILPEGMTREEFLSELRDSGALEEVAKTMNVDL